METHICTRRTTTHQFIWQQQHTCGALGWSPLEWGVVGQHYETPYFHPRHQASTYPPGMTFPRTAWVRLNRLRTGVERFRSCLHKWGMASSAACERGAEEQTVDRIVPQCTIHRPPQGPRSDGSEWWDIWMAAQHLPQDLVRPVNGL